MAKVVVLSGAGLSAESGISTFRDSDGLWENYDVGVVCNYDSMQKNETITIEFYDKRREELEAKEPNKAHKVLARLKKEYPQEIALITQNVDNLFEKAGLEESEVMHLHGYLPELRCQNSRCGKIFKVGYAKQSSFHDGVCPSCGTTLRPNIVFFGEAAPMYEQLNYELNDCELLVVLGTSGNVVGVNTMANYAKKSILNNLEASPAIEEELFDIVLYKKATEAIETIAYEIESFLDSEF